MQPRALPWADRCDPCGVMSTQIGCRQSNLRGLFHVAVISA
ncbi:MAG: hypothetical protein [Olavius algarvensis Gamma 1 endosymbiont]|nr:MAG: hypothetical protein [Olavius algarvensis Gamma 1 endosymbiont]